jgi:hypothetical protein
MKSSATGGFGEPWWHITANCTALIDEIRRARKPKQTLKAKDEKNPSEQIRDKDNHAIDAIKYLFMMTHDLRPQEVREQLPIEVPDFMRDASPVDTSLALPPRYDGGTQWQLSGGYDFSELGF